MNVRHLPLDQQTERLRIDFIKAGLENGLTKIQRDRLQQDPYPQEALSEAIQTYRTAQRFMALSDDALTEQDQRFMIASLELLRAAIKGLNPSARI